MVKYVSPELCDKYKHQVLEISPAIQYYEGTLARRESSSLSDQKIADKLGRDVDDVTEIRCIAEIDLLPAEAWIQAANWKHEAVLQSFKRQRLSRKG
ncbi:MAG: hypothetical protein CL875_05880 [Dehalococcoidales bacterium]|nr:hypothetical protein [Dehalococcoidales bacterium]|tara:strand:- start:339 stop:629 length:291 start_codon:yes stop_codon:yes gene_type:complete